MNKKPAKIKSNKVYYYIVGFAVVFLLFYLVSLPIRKSLAQKYLDSGDQKLLTGHYIGAIVEYKKSEYLYPSNTIRSKIELSMQSQKDIKALLDFFKSENQENSLSDIKQAEAVPEDEFESVESAKKLLEDQKPQLAILAATTASEMDKNYRDAWLYLGISHIATAKNVELTNDNRNWHLEQAGEALTKAKNLDLTYEPTLSYLKQIESL